MASLKSGYTLVDFMLRLERSPVTHMSPLYHENRQLFLHRPDIFDKIILSVGWEKGLALVDAAYYTQRVEVSTYRAVLARMLLHNRHVDRLQSQKNGAGAGAAGPSGAPAQYVDWRAAMKVYTEALTAHGHAVPSRLAVSTLRLLTPHGSVAAARRVLRIAEATEMLTRPMLVDAAACCANGGEWAEALRLLDCLHREDPLLLTGAIQSLRPAGSDAVSTASALASSGAGAAAAVAEDGITLLNAQVFPGNSPFPEPPTPQQRHILRALNAVVAATPGPAALTSELCFSYLTHLAASTTLSAEDKTAALGSAIAKLSWPEAVTLLTAYAEPNLLEDGEWAALQQRLPRPQTLALAGKQRKLKKRRGAASKKIVKAKRELLARQQLTATGLEDALVQAEGEEEEAADEASGAVTAANSTTAAVATLLGRLRLAECSPATTATFLAVLASKLPSVAEAWRLAVTAGHAAPADQQQVPMLVPVVASAGGDGGSPSSPSPEWALEVTADSLSQAVAAAAQLHPVVRRALLRKCAEAAAAAGGDATTTTTTTTTTGGWPVAAAILLAQGGSHGATPAGVLGPIVLELRAARQVLLLMRVLLEHIVPTRGRLGDDALEALFECILAHNRAAHRLQAEAATAAIASGEPLLPEDLSPAGSAPVVPWQAALGWAEEHLRADGQEDRIVATGTGPSAGGVQRRGTVIATEEHAMSARLLSLLVRICVDAGSPAGALQALGHARRVGKTELRFSDELRAVLHCMQYDRPFEAEAVVRHAEERYGAGAATAPLRNLLSLAQGAKMREESVAALTEREGY